MTKIDLANIRKSLEDERKTWFKETQGGSVYTPKYSPRLEQAHRTIAAMADALEEAKVFAIALSEARTESGGIPELADRARTFLERVE